MSETRDPCLYTQGGVKITHKPKHYKTYQLYSVEDIFKRIDAGEVIVTLPNQMTAGLSSPRLLVFKTKGVTCVSCGLQGKYFSAEKSKTGNDKNLHFNLYSETGTLITKDHIVAKSKGGKNHLSNYQTMCSPCNSLKADI